MAGEIAGVLLVPEAGDPLGLLAEGARGARVPSVWSGWLCGHAGHRAWVMHDEAWHDCYMCRNGLRGALVLAWDGAVVREGRDRAAYVLLDATNCIGGPGSYVGIKVMRAAYLGGWGNWREIGLHWVLDREQNPIPLNDRPESLPASMTAAFDLARVAAARGLGRVVLLDATGAEVTP